MPLKWLWEISLISLNLVRCLVKIEINIIHVVYTGPSGEDPPGLTLDSISSNSVSTVSSSGASETQDSPSLSCPPPIDHRHDWERFDEEDEMSVSTASSNRPPLPPPRSELEQLYSTVNKKLTNEPTSFPAKSSSAVELTVRNPSPIPQSSSNPFLPTEGSRPKSPFEDFSSSIGKALITNSEQKLAGDPASASTLATTGKELFDTIQEEEQTERGNVLESLDSQVSFSSTPVLTPSTALSLGSSMSQSSTQTGLSSAALRNPVSSGAPTVDVSTAQPRAVVNPVTQFRANSVGRQYYSVLRPIPQEGTFSPDSIASNTNPFYSGSINAGHYPALVPLPQKPSGPRSPSYRQNFPLPGSSKAMNRTVDTTNSHLSSHRRPGQPPPPKPQPYSGVYQTQSHEATSSSDATWRRQASTTFMPQRLPSLGTFDPFGDLLNSGEGGMAGYVLENNNAS